MKLFIRNGINAVAAALLLLPPKAWSCIEAEWRERHRHIEGSVDDRFGHGRSVAIHDGILAVGAYGDYGYVYLYVSIDGYWSIQEVLTANDGPGGHFGYSLAISDERIAVGAPEKDDYLVGAAYVYTRRQVDGLYTEQAKLTPSDPDVFYEFGYTVVLQGTSLVVGSPHRGSSDATGSVYAYELVSGAWTEQQKLTASDGRAGSWFGLSLAIDNDKLFVGAHFDDTWKGFTGSVYAFERVDGVWTEQAKLVGSDGDEEWRYRFGWSIAVEGDTLAVGAYLMKATVYVFEFTEGHWSERTKLLSSNGDANNDVDHFGWAVAISEGTLAVGAPDDNDSGNNAGAVYTFCRVDGSWTEQAKLTASDGAEDSTFGMSVAVDDGAMVVGAFENYRGSVYVIEQVLSQACTRWLSRCEAHDECCSGVCRWGRCRLFGFPQFF